MYAYPLKDQLNDKKVIVYGWREEAKKFAIRLLQEDISVDCFLFVGENKYFLPSLMNRPIIDLDTCKVMENVVIVVPYLQVEEAQKVLKKNGLIQLLIEIEQINLELRQAGQVAIYGTGSRAESLYRKMKDDLNVQYIVDSYKEGTWHGKKIISPIELANLPKDIVVLIASTYTQEISKVLIENGIACERIYSIEDQLVISVDGMQWRYTKECLCKISNDIDIKNKGITIYGLRKVADIVKRKMQLLGFQVHKVVGRDTVEEDGTIYQLLYESGVYIITDHYSKTAQDALRQMDLAGNLYIWLEEYDQFWLVSKNEEYHCDLDPLLGHAYVKDEEEYPGFIKYTWSNTNNNSERLVSIVILGGSAVSGFGVRQTPWCRYLSDILTENEVSHVIYNGGVDSYSATQDLIKLQRDGILLNPDIVISYSGVNNMWEWSPNPAISQYQGILFKSIASQFKPNITDLSKANRVNWGIENTMPVFEFWFSQVKMQKAVCDSIGIRFFSFIQPLLYIKKISSDKDKDLNIAALAGFLFDKERNDFIEVEKSSESVKTLCRNAKQFRQKANTINETWCYNLMNLFDYQKNVYIDNVHLHEEGNKIVAKTVYEKIRNEIERRKKTR